MKKIIFLATQELDKRNFNRFGINILNEDFDVEFWDLRSLFQNMYLNKKRNDKIYKTFNSYYELFKQILLIKDKFYFIDFLSYFNIPILLAKKILKLKGGINLYINVGPTIQDPKKLKSDIFNFLKKLKTKNYIFNVLNFRYRSLLKKILQIDYDFYFIGGYRDLEKFDKKKIIYSHNLDYNIYLDLKKKKTHQ